MQHLPTPIEGVDPSHVPQLVRHSKKPEWGRGALIWTRPTKRAYQFEDGQMRLFKDAFYDLLEPIEPDTVAADALVDRLQERGEARQSVREARRAARKAKPIVDAKGNFDAQIRWFKDAWPGGFDGEPWRAAHRKTERRTLKRHREPVVDRARELFAASAFEELDDSAAERMRDAMVALFDSTDLVPPAHRKRLAAAQVDVKWLYALRDLVHGDAAIQVRFERWVTELRRMGTEVCTWPIATAPLALVQPEDRVLVRRSLMKRQLQRIRPGVVIPTVPGAPTLASVTNALDWMRERLAKAGLTPADNLDMYDFVRVTLATKALRAIEGR